MKEYKCDLFGPAADATVITTNGFVTTAGKCVMGRGCAAKAATMYPTIATRLGSLIVLQGNRVHELGKNGPHNLVSFPVKPISGTASATCTNIVKHMRSRFKPGMTVPGWAMKADPAIIRQSAHQLLALTNERSWKSVILPRPGCGAGELSWSIIGPMLSEILDDRFTAVTF